MTTGVFIKEFAVENFRTFSHLDVPCWRRLNLVGGFNASGKSSLLETIFLALDRRSPIAVAKPMLWRQATPVGATPNLKGLFPNLPLKAEIRLTHRDGADKISLKYTSIPDHVSISMPVQTPGYNPRGFDAGPATMGIDLQCERDATQDDASFLAETPQGLVGTVYRSSTSPVPPSIFVSTTTRLAPQETAGRLTTIIKANRKKDLIATLALMQKNLADLQILQEGESSCVYATCGDEMLPIAMLGDGFLNLINAVIAIMNAENGVVLLDEIDSAMHWSVVADIWKIIANLASEYNCQIFATSHSRESILSAARGIARAGCEKDLTYIRLNKLRDKHVHTAYLHNDLKDAEDLNAEIR
jgi:hypothetical protein